MTVALLGGQGASGAGPALPAGLGGWSGGQAPFFSLPSATGDGDGDGAGSADGADEAGEPSAVSLLQELIQRNSTFNPHTRILTWNFEQQLQTDTSLRFRATVSFSFGHVPHSFWGGWRSSKKKAQRDTAERVRRYLLERLGDTRSCEPAHAAIDPQSLPSDVLQELEEACAPDAAASHSGCVEWQFEERGPASQPPASSQERFRAILTFCGHGMPHHFRGSWCSSEAAAKRDAAERVLWYFGRGSQAFATAGAAPAEKKRVSLPLAQLNEPPSEDSQQAVEDRTLLMQVQNTLQRAFARETPPGQRVWLWSYEGHDKDIQLFRARVDVPCWQRSFHGDWRRGKKGAQRSACLEVKRHLDELPSPAAF